jgi:hypothetical protein
MFLLKRKQVTSKRIPMGVSWLLGNGNLRHENMKLVISKKKRIVEIQMLIKA